MPVCCFLSHTKNVSFQSCIKWTALVEVWQIGNLRKLI